MTFEDSIASDDAANRPAQFMELYTQFHRQLYVYIAALVPNASDAQDLLQETSLTLWKKFDEFTPGSSFLAWARAVARFRILQFHERSGRSVGLLPADVLDLLSANVEATPSLEAEESHFQALMACLEKLRVADRELIRARYNRKAAVQAIAAEQGRSANAISQSLARIRSTLFDCVRLRLKRDGGGPQHA